MNRKSSTVSEREELERLVREARMKRSAYLGEAIAGMARAMWNRTSAWLGERGNPRVPAAG